MKEKLYSIMLIETVLKCIIENTPKTRTYNNLRPYLPYCIQDMGEGKWIPLNRDYKPIGLARSEFVKYEDFEFLFLCEEHINFDILWDNGKCLGRHGYFLFSDIYKPVGSNLKRYIEILGLAFLTKERVSFNKETFIYFWEDKKYASNSEEWEKNMNRFLS